MATTITNSMIEEPSKDDVICGRGGKSNHHPGNIAFRAIIADRHLEYLQCNRSQKTNMTVELLRDFRAAGVRFLRHDMNHSDRCWFEVGDQLARTKISQALRDSTTTTSAVPSSTTSDNDDVKPKTDDTCRKKRKPVAPPPSRSEKPKRVAGFHDTIFHHEAVTPAITTADAMMSTTQQLREVSPFPSRTTSVTPGGLFVPSLKVLGPSLQHYSDGEERHDPPVHANSAAILRGSYYVSPTEATLFELLEHEDSNKFSSIAVSSSSSRWSIGGSGPRLLLNCHNPFVLPDLPSRDDAPLRLPSIGVKVWDEDVDAPTHRDHYGSALLHEDNNDQTQPPREVSPISFPAVLSPQQPVDGHGGGSGGMTMRRSWTPATFALLNEEAFDDYLSDTTPPADDDDYFVCRPHVDKSVNNDPVLSPSRRPEPCSNDGDDGWTSSSTYLDDDDDLDDSDAPVVASYALTSSTTTSTFERATFSAFRPFTTTAGK